MTDRTELRRLLDEPRGPRQYRRDHYNCCPCRDCKAMRADYMRWWRARPAAGARVSVPVAKLTAVLDQLDAAEAALARVREGRDDSPRDEDRWATPGQMWAMLIDSPPSERTVLLEAALRAMDAEHRCIIGFHQEAVQQRDALRAELAHMTEARDNARAEVGRLSAAVDRVRELHERESFWQYDRDQERSYLTQQDAADDSGCDCPEDPESVYLAHTPECLATITHFDVCTECARIEYADAERQAHGHFSGYAESLWPCPTIAAIGGEKSC